MRERLSALWRLARFASQVLLLGAAIRGCSRAARKFEARAIENALPESVPNPAASATGPETRTVRIIEPELCDGCRYNRADVFYSDARGLMRQIDCRRGDCDNWDGYAAIYENSRQSSGE